MNYKVSDFPKWLATALEERSWSMRELARRAEISHTWVADVLNSSREASWDFCAAIAGPLGISPVEMLLIAGKIRPIDIRRAVASLPGGTPLVDQLGARAELLSDEDQRVLLRVADSMVKSSSPLERTARGDERLLDHPLAREEEDEIDREVEKIIYDEGVRRIILDGLEELKATDYETYRRVVKQLAAAALANREAAEQ